MTGNYTPQNWFWIVAGDESRAWSSAAGAYVETWDAERHTRIASEDDLNGVLRPYGLALPAPTLDDYKVSVQSHIDETARACNYTDGVSLASYKNSTIPQWSAEATVFIAWRDSVWASVYQTMANVQAGQQTQPTIAELIGSIEPIAWP